MALYRIKRGGHSGEFRHLPNSQEVNLALLLGDIEFVEPDKPARPKEPKWQVLNLAMQGEPPRIVLRGELPARGETIQFDGAIPSSAFDAFVRYCQPWPPTKESIEAYSRARNATAADPLAVHEQDGRKRAELEEAMRTNSRMAVAEIARNGGMV